MKLPLVCVLALVLICLAYPKWKVAPVAPAPVASKLVSKVDFINKTYHTAVALMYTREKDGAFHDRCSATAFATRDISPTLAQYLFVSASHCVDDRPPLWLGDDTEKGGRYPAIVVASGLQADGFDFSILGIVAPKGEFTVMPLGLNPHQQGELVFSINSPKGIGRAYMTGIISETDILDPRTTAVNGDSNWQHNILYYALGSGPGSSGGSLVCEDQMKICGILIGHLEGGMVAEPIERFYFWYKGVTEGNIPRFAPPKEGV